MNRRINRFGNRMRVLVMNNKVMMWTWSTG